MTQKIETNLIQSIASSEIKNITDDFCELGLDAMLNEGVLKDIPVFGTLTKLYSVGATKDKIFEKKILKFLFELKKISENERNDFTQKINSNEKQAQKIGEHILVILDRLDDLYKPIILAKLLSANIQGKIDYEMFVRLSSIIDKSLVSDINKLKDYRESQFSSFTATSLQNTGLVKLSVMNPNIAFDVNGNQTSGSLYAVSELGEILIEILHNN
jgi:hypothetical protein